MALELHEQVSAALLDVLHGGWAQYLELEDGTRVRTSWHKGEDGDEWLRVENTETGHVRDLLVSIRCVDLGTPSEPEVAESLPGLEAPVEEQPEREMTWGKACGGDLAKGDNGSWYEVVSSIPGTGPNEGRAMVMMDLGGDLKQYPMDPAGAVTLKRGPAGRAMDTLAAAGLGPEVIQS